MWRLINTAFDRAKATQHRTAPKFDPEPYFNGRRLRRGEKMDIDDGVYSRCEKQLKDWERTGVIDLIHLSASGEPQPDGGVIIEKDKDGLRLDGPTFEEWTASGYPPEKYPPADYASKPSPGLDAWKAEEAARQERASASTMDERPAIIPPPPEPAVDTLFDDKPEPHEDPPHEGGHPGKKGKSKKLFGG